MGQTIFAMYIFKCAICIVGLRSISKKGLIANQRATVTKPGVIQFIEAAFVKK